MAMLKPLPLHGKTLLSTHDPRFYRRPKGPVTIAIGFAYDNGLLFCVDTKITSNIKTNESKIEYRVSEDRNCSITFAMSSVDMDYPRNAINKCWESVSSMEFGTATMQQLHHAVEFSLAEFYREHIYPHPDRTPEQVFLQILIGIWLGGQTALYVSRETVLTPVDHYECIGQGAYLAKFILRDYFRANQGANTLQDAGLIAQLTVESAIDYDETCGGDAEMFIVRNSGTTDSICPAVLYPAMSMTKAVQQGGWKLLHDLAQISDNFEDATAQRIEEYSQSLRDANDGCKLHFDAMREQKIKDPHRWD